MVLWNPKNISEINIADNGINRAVLFLKFAPEKRARPPIGAKLGAWGIRRVTTANKIIAKIETLDLISGFFHLCRDYKTTSLSFPYFRAKSKNKSDKRLRYLIISSSSLVIFFLLK